jgi:hypothetical protein
MKCKKMKNYKNVKFKVSHLKPRTSIPLIILGEYLKPKKWEK